MLPSYEEIREDKKRFCGKLFTGSTAARIPFSGKRLAERYGTVYVVQNPPAKPLSTREMDEVYGLPYCRTWHPSYDKEGGVPAFV